MEATMGSNNHKREIFNQIPATYMSKTIQFARLFRGKTRKDMVRLLAEEDDWIDATEHLIFQIECGCRELAFNEFVDFCEALGNSVDDMLESAKLLQKETEQTCEAYGGLFI